MDIFSSVAGHYDLMNDLMSFGIHRIWKNTMIQKIGDFNGKLIDVAGGTGDIAARFYKKALEKHITPNIVICDINADMLEQGRSNLIDKNLWKNVKFCTCNAQELPFENNSFDYYTIAFGIRNVSDINAALKEAHRVLKPMGKFICLEFSRVDNAVLRRLYDFYSSFVIPKIGQLVAKNEDAYQYLVDSIRAFPKQEEFLQIINQAGFEKSKYCNLSNGVVAIHTGWKL